MKCPNCSTENPPGKIVCKNCGRRLRVTGVTAAAVWQSEEELMARVRGDVRRIALVTAAVAAAGVALGFIIR